MGRAAQWGGGARCWRRWIRLGALLLAGGIYLLRRGPKSPDPAKGKGLISRMIAWPGHKTAFIVGVLVYSPSLTFVAAVQAVATSKQNVAVSVLELAVVIAITLAFVWVPLLLYLLMPDRTGRLLGSFNGWLRSHCHGLVAGAMTIAGVLLVIDGILGLTGAVS